MRLVSNRSRAGDMGQLTQMLKTRKQETANPFVVPIPRTPPAVAAAAYGSPSIPQATSLDVRFPAACLHYSLAMEGV